MRSLEAILLLKVDRSVHNSLSWKSSGKSANTVGGVSVFRAVGVVTSRGAFEGEASHFIGIEALEGVGIRVDPVKPRELSIGQH